MKETTVVIIGGGATGTGILRDLCMRGVRAILLEKGGLCCGTSSRFHGLLHSGCRYAVSDTEAAAECVSENMILRRIGKQCVQSEEGFFVLTAKDDPSYVGKWMEGCEKAGIAVSEISVQEARTLEPSLAPDIQRVFRVPDATIDGFRLGLHNTMSAARYGGETLTYHEVVGITKESGKVTGVDAVNVKTGEMLHIACRMVVNAAGSWSGRIAALAGLDVGVTPDKGTLIVFNHRFASRVVNRLHKASDGDIFVPHGSITILGTTSQTVEDPSESGSTTAEVLHLMEVGRPLFPAVDKYRILRTFAGTRPLYTPHGTSGRGATRGFHIADHYDEGLEGMITIFGGKFTTYRLMAEKLCDVVCGKLGVTTPCRTAEEPIIPNPSSALLKKAEKVFPVASLPLVADRLGDALEDCVDKALAKSKLFNPVMCECEMVSWAELEYVARDSQTYSINDIRTRTRLGMGTCQGTFCPMRTAAALVEHGVPYEKDPLGDMEHFLQERWKGVRCVYWGLLAREMEMNRSLYFSALNLNAEEGYAPSSFVSHIPAPTAPAATPAVNTRFSSHADTVVVGAGLAGLVAALASARSGQQVAILSIGAGALSIGSADIDVLGRTHAGLVTGNPLDSIGTLTPTHPYTLLGRQRVEDSLAFLEDLGDEISYPFTGFSANEGDCRNSFIPTVLGTLRPSCMVPQSMDVSWLQGARRILVCGIEGLRDCTPALAVHGFSRNETFSGCEFGTAWLESPIKGAYRTVTALDVARALDNPIGLEKFCRSLASKSKGYDAVLLPPVMGTRPSNSVMKALHHAAGCPVLEMCGMPPGVSGLRLRQMFIELLRREGVVFIENTKVSGCTRSGTRVNSLLVQHEDGLRSWNAERFIVATGGITSGGIALEPGVAREAVLGLTYQLPAETADWLDINIDAPQQFSMLGVPVTSSLEPTLDGETPLVTNMRYAGLVLGGVDPVFGKCINGIALSTGFQAAVTPWA